MASNSAPNNVPSTSKTFSTFSEKLKHSFSYRKKTWLIAAFFLAGAVIAAFIFRIPHAHNNQNAVSLEQPDVWVHSQNFSLLPHDLLQVPLLKSLLTEDFVYFYAQDEDWLSLQGAMRRISFEHDLNWSDALLKNIANAPADVYMWHDDSHALRYWALSLERDQFTVIAQKLATLKLTSDKQLHQIARIRIDGDDVPVLRISLSARRQMVLASHNNRLVLLSDIAMASHEGDGLDGQTEQLIKRLLADDAATRAQVVSEWQMSSKADSVAESKQTILLSNRFFAQGYAAFLPSMRALRFDYDGKAWQTQANLTSSAFDSKIWTYLPANAAFCVITPIDWVQVQKALDGAKELSVAPKLASELAATGAACWYAEEGDDISQPLFVALRQSGKSTSEPLAALFDWGVATNQDYLKEVLALNRQKRNLRQRLEAAKYNFEQARQQKIDPKLDKERKVAEAARIDANKIAAKAVIDAIEKELAEIAPKISAALEAAKAPAIAAKEKTVEHDGDFTILSRKLAIDSESENSPRLAFDKQVVYFSTNQALIARAVAVGQKKYPNLQESSPVFGQTSLNQTSQQFLFVNPKKLSTLLTNTGHQALPQETKSRLRAAFDYHMPARLQALAKQAPFSLALDKLSAKAGSTDSASQWQVLTWHTAP
jgi:uncharacterized protein YfaA (DUF2138 family)